MKTPPAHHKANSPHPPWKPENNGINIHSMAAKSSKRVREVQAEHKIQPSTPYKTDWRVFELKTQPCPLLGSYMR